MAKFCDRPYWARTRADTVPRRCVRLDQIGVERRQLNDTAVRLDGVQLRIGQIARVFDPGAGVRMGRRDRRARQSQRLSQGLTGQLRDIYQDAEVVQSGHSLPSYGRKAVMFGDWRIDRARRVGKCVVPRMVEGEHPHAFAIEDVDLAQVRADRTRILESDQNSDPALADQTFDIVSTQGQSDPLRVGRHERLDRRQLGVSLRARFSHARRIPRPWPDSHGQNDGVHAAARQMVEVDTRPSVGQPIPLRRRRQQDIGMPVQNERGSMHRGRIEILILRLGVSLNRPKSSAPKRQRAGACCD